jgi:hypothetical protein
MRVEVHGCPYSSPVSSYQAPQGEEFSPHIFLEDIYDGEKIFKILRGGLGLLSDGNSIGQGMKRKQTNCWTNKKSPLQLSFVFRSFQSIQEVNIVAYNKPDMGIEVRS